MRRKVYVNLLQVCVKFCLDDIQIFNFNVIRIIKNFSYKFKLDGFWNQDFDRLLIYDEFSFIESEGQGCFEIFILEVIGLVFLVLVMVMLDENNESDEGEDVDSDFLKFLLDFFFLQCIILLFRIVDVVVVDFCVV